jgi:hypothetical protein
MKHWWISSIAALLALPAWHSSQAQGVQVYRCTRADGSVALQDSPCAKDAAQELRTLKRPPPGTPPAAPAPEPAPAEVPEDAPADGAIGHPPPAAPAPLFECITHDGNTYQNDTGTGKMRWVPLWVLGMDPKVPARPSQRNGATPASQPGAPDKTPAGAAGAGTWIRDTCYELSPAKVCERRRDRLDELRKQRRLAQSTARVPLDAEFDKLIELYDAECH